MLNKGVVAIIAVVAMLSAAVATAKTERDPTRPGNVAGAPVTEGAGVPIVSRFVLNAIFYSTDRSQAIINEQVVMVGSQLQNAMVSKIERDSVVMLVEEQGVMRETVLRLPSHASVKRDASEDF